MEVKIKRTREKIMFDSRGEWMWWRRWALPLLCTVVVVHCQAAVRLFAYLDLHIERKSAYACVDCFLCSLDAIQFLKLYTLKLCTTCSKTLLH
jgi:hypothetical protein